MSTLLLEIGTEEIPARFLPDAIEDLKRLTQEGMAGHSIKVSAENIKAYATPRRLVVTVRDIPERQEDRVKEVFGPPKKIAFNPDGTLTKAGLKFAESVGLTPDKLFVKKKEKGEYLAAEVAEKGLPVKEVLPDALKKIILSLSFPKSMRWGDGTLRFVRPIRWLVAMLDSEVIPFEIGGIKSSDLTRGHRFLSPEPVRLDHAESYERLLAENSVVVDGQKRKGAILEEMKGLSSSVSGSIPMDEELLETVINLVEYPHAVMGRFPHEYLALPPELLTTVMKVHQKYFPVTAANGDLLDCFILISNMGAETGDTVRKGAERVIKARLEDAQFYYEKDKGKKLIDRLDDLKKVIYHEQLGALYDKTKRVYMIAESLAKKVWSQPGPEAGNYVLIGQAAKLSKCDLVTGVVREFPELQGVMGGYYAKGDGAEERICRALREQYIYDREDIRGMSDFGAVLNLADKIDNIASFFHLGLKPTGSEDPFALRRQAIAVIEILLEKKFEVSIRKLLEEALGRLGLNEEGRRPLRGELRGFFEARFEVLLEGRYPKDVVSSVLSLSTDKSLKDILGRMDALRGFKSHADYQGFLLAVKRIRNIMPKREMPSPEPELFKEEEEKRLFKVLTNVKGKAAEFIEDALYQDALNVFSGLTQPINDFFDKVLVMDKDEGVRENRLALLSSVWETVSAFSDFSRLKETSAA